MGSVESFEDKQRIKFRGVTRSSATLFKRLQIFLFSANQIVITLQLTPVLEVLNEAGPLNAKYSSVLMRELSSANAEDCYSNEYWQTHRGVQWLTL